MPDQVWRDARQHRPDKPGGNRTPAQRDRDRLLYSPAFRRLQAVTQVIPSAEEGYLQHNRLTHSLKVAQIGRRIAERFNVEFGNRTKAISARGGLDPDVVEAACLAHDLGHPPFGHVAEHELQRLLASSGVTDTFEGNAQSFRIVTTLSSTSLDFVGLDLTRATLNAVLKYPWMHATKPDLMKWGAYETETMNFDWARGGQFTGDSRSLEADIMDYADDVTYAIHDVDDFFRVGLIPMGDLRHDGSDRLDELITRARNRIRTEKVTCAYPMRPLMT